MTPITNQIRNLIELTNNHRQHCNEPCTVNLYFVKETVNFLMRYMALTEHDISEMKELENLINRTNFL